MAEVAMLIAAEYREGIEKVRNTIVSIPALRTEEWSSLTKHISELYILDKFGYLRCCSADSVVDGIIPLPGETEVRFDPGDQLFLLNRGIQVKGCRSVRRYGQTGNVKLTSPFKYLYAVWLNVNYQVNELEVYRFEYRVVKQLIDERNRTNPDGKTNCKITWADAKREGVRVNPESRANIVRPAPPRSG
jgi:hypothetical protein